MEEVQQYGYVYLTVNIVNKKIYIGQAKNKKRKETYLGSGTILLQAIEKHGRENFENKPIDFAYSQEELNEKEIFHIKWFRDNGFAMYNISSGGEYGDTFTYSPNKEQRRKNHSEGAKNSEKLKASKKSKETKQKLSNTKTGVKQERDVCIHCKKEFALNILTRYHNDHCYKNPNIDIKAERLRRKQKPVSEEGRKRYILCKKDVKQKIATYTHCGKTAGINQIKRWHNENCLKNPDIDIEVERLRRKHKKERKHKYLRIENGRYIYNKEIKQKIKCECIYCHIITSIVNINRFHNDHCYQNPNIDINAEKKRRQRREYKTEICIYCKKELSLANLKQFHGNHCLKNPNLDKEAETLRRKKSKYKKRIGLKRGKYKIKQIL